MASIREVSSIAEDLLCSICLSIFQEPRMLSCGHNFCLTCLESCVTPKGQHQGTCPQCRYPFSLRDAVCNRVLANLAEKARLLRLEEGAQSDRDRSWYFCEEHEEPLKLFCSEDEVLLCVICRDLPQHQGHCFLPVKNAVKDCQSKLKASLKSLEDGMKWATNNTSRQQEAIEELEGLSQHLYGHIFIEFEHLRQILDVKEQSMMDTVKQLTEDNQAEMERRLEYLKACKSSCGDTISRIQTALEEPNEFALLKGIKELMAQTQNCLRKGNREAGHDEGTEKTEDKDTGGEKFDVNIPEGKGDETKTDEGDAYEESQDEGQDADEVGGSGIVSVDCALRELEEKLDFETWKEILESICIDEVYNLDSLYQFPSSQKDMFQPGDGNTSEAAEEKTGSLEEDLTCAPDDVTSVLEEVASDKPSSCSNTALPVEKPLHRLPPIPCIPNYFPVSVSQQIPPYNAVQGWGSLYRWRPNLRRGSFVPPGRGGLAGPSFWTIQGQGRSFPNTQRPQNTEGSWRSPPKDPFQVQKADPSGQGKGGFNKHKPPSSGSSMSVQSGGGRTRSSNPRGAHSSGQGVSGQGRGSAQRGPTHHSGGQASSNKGTANRQTSNRGGRGSGSAKGSCRK